MLGEIIEYDTTNEILASVQTAIKIQSNGLMNLSYEQLNENEELIAKIIYGAFDDFKMEDRKALSAISWYQIFQTQFSKGKKK
jgi:hypothetical protein